MRIYLDMEGDPDEGYVYLIGMIVAQGDSETKHSFWADDKEQEYRIFEDFLAEVGKFEDFQVFCYGGTSGPSSCECESRQSGKGLWTKYSRLWSTPSR